MSEECIIKYCSPTLAGLKTGNMFTCPYRNANEILAFLRKWNVALGVKGIRLLPLRFKSGRALIYVYRPSRLRHDLRDREACRILVERGYCTASCDRCVVRLIERLHECEEFPHEIGLFLGYPTDDVKGFMKNAGECKLVGCWKVYGDREKAQKLFDRYKKCTQVYCRQWADGKSLRELTVAH